MLQEQVITVSSQNHESDLRGARDIQDSGDSFSLREVRRSPPSEVPIVAAEWDAGNTACGELVMALRWRMKELPAGAILKVTATDSVAVEDLPAWCRLCGHALVAMNPPHYFIQRKGD